MKCDVIVLTKAANGLVYKSIEELTVHSRHNIGTLIVCYTGDSQEDLKKLDKMLDDIPVNSVLEYGEYNFAKLNNEMVKKHVSSECVLFMNDDVILHSDALAPCLKILEDKSFGAVGIKLLYGDGTIQHAGVFWACNKSGMCQGVGHLHHREKNRAIPPYSVPGVTGAFLMMRLEDFNSIGGFDENFKHCFEDVVLCKRIKDKGMSIICNNFIEATHYESQTRKQAICREDTQRLMEILNEHIK